MTEKLVPPLSPARPITGTGHANGEIADKLTRISAAEQAEREIRGEMSRLADANAAFFAERAEAASARAAEAASAVAEAIRVADARRGEAGEAWVLPRATAHRGHPMPNDFVPADFAPVSSALARLLRVDPFWPGGRRTAYESWSAERGRAGKNTASKLSNAEAVARLAGETA